MKKRAEQILAMTPLPVIPVKTGIQVFLLLLPLEGGGQRWG